MEYYGRKRESLMPVLLAGLVGAVLGGLIVVCVVFSLYPPAAKTTAGAVTGYETIDVSQYIPQDEAIYRATVISDVLQPAVVGISNFQRSRGTFGSSTGPVEYSGSGFIYDAAQGLIVTNNHVVQDADEIIVTLSDATTVPAKLVGGDSRTDLAVIRIESTANMQSVPIGNSDVLKVGEPVIAIGNPGGNDFAGSVTQGIISALNRFLELEGEASFNLIQTDAAINPGNSGGPLVNFKGEVIAINSAKYNVDGFEGMGFAIPIMEAEPIIKQIIEKGYVSHAALMISIDGNYTAEFASYRNMPEGCYVSKVQGSGAADQAGIKVGDIVTAINGVPTKNSLQLAHELFKYKPGGTVDITYYRNSESQVVKVTLGELRS